MNSLYLNDFYSYLANEKRYSHHTVLAYKRDLSLFFEYLKKQSIDVVDRIILQSYFSEIYMSGASKKTMSRKLSSIKSYGKYLSKYKNINCDFLLGITLPKKDVIIPDYLHEEEIGKLLNLELNTTLDIRNSLIIHLLYSSGIRLSELTSLKISDYNDSENVFKIKGKGNKERIVIYSDKTKELIELYLKNRIDNCDYLLVNKNGSKLSNRGVELILTNISKKYLGHDKLHPHMLRHTYATKLLNNGIDIRVLQELLGHDSLNATQVYTHVAKSELTRAYKAFHPRANKTGG
ncbi:MAG: tyrosine-type recombinase/integrase [Bacilli bacterium]|nr:tyrosine-type recombinase/integrase [Bacilli bacterium]